MPSRTPLQFASRFQLSTADFQLFRTNSFRLIQFRKNASVSPLVSHSFKTKDLKPFRFTHFQKKAGGGKRFLRGPTCSGRAFLASPDSIGRSGRGLCLGPNAGHGSRITAAMDPLRHQPPLLPLSRPIATHQPTLRDDGSRNDMIFGPPSGRGTEVQK